MKKKAAINEKMEGNKSRERLGIVSPTKKEMSAKAARKRNDKHLKASATALSGTHESAKKTEKPNSTPTTAIKRRPSLNSRKLKRVNQPLDLKSSDKKLMLSGAQL